MTSVCRFPRARLGSVLSMFAFSGSFAARGRPSAPRARHSLPARSSRALSHRASLLHTLAARTLTW